MIDERSIVNGIVGLHATGGSTNHTIHLIAMAHAAGIAHHLAGYFRPLGGRAAAGARLSERLADVNHFHAAGGMGFLIRELLDAGLLHEDVQTVWGEGLRPYAVEAKLGADGTRGARAGAARERRREGAGAVRRRRSSRPAA